MKKELIEVREQIQEDLMIYLDGIDEAVGNEEQEIITKVCQIVVDNFNKLDIGLGYSLPSPRKR